MMASEQEHVQERTIENLGGKTESKRQENR